VRVVLGLVLLVAAGMKAHQFATQPAIASEMLGSRGLSIGLVEAELLLGLLLLFGLFQCAAWVACLAFFGAACVASLYKALAGEASCGCFGSVVVNPWVTLLIDLSIVAALVSRAPDLRRRANASPRLAGLGTVFLLLSIAATGVAILRSSATLPAVEQLDFTRQRVLLQPERWIGRALPIQSKIDGGSQLARGEWSVVLYRPSCAHCQSIMRRYDELAANDELRERRVAFVEIPPHDPAGAATHFAHSSRFVLTRLDPGKQWLLQYLPTEILVRDGVVQSVRLPDTAAELSGG
jgi:hypothetical protein